MSEHEDAVIAREAKAFLATFIKQLIKDGPTSPVVDVMIGTVAAQMLEELDLDGDPVEVRKELQRRTTRLLIMMTVAAQLTAEVIQAAEKAGLTVDWKLLDSPFDAVIELGDDPSAWN